MTVKYATLSQVKAALRITDQIDDSLLNTSIDAASRWVDGWCGRTFTKASGTATKGLCAVRPDGTPVRQRPDDRRELSVLTRIWTGRSRRS
jgi:hypothetical protein